MAENKVEVPGVNTSSRTSDHDQAKKEEVETMKPNDQMNNIQNMQSSVKNLQKTLDKSTPDEAKEQMMPA